MEKLEFENKLFEAIKTDDLKSFAFIMQTNLDLNLCYGRFPLLSLMYLYSSFKILSKYETKLLKVKDFRIVDERIEIYKKFRRVAGKSLRLFQGNELVYPILMLGVLNEETILKHNYDLLYKNVEINEKLEKIYKINKNFKINKEDKIVFPKRKLGKIYYLFSVGLICFLGVIIALSSVCVGFVSNKIGLGTATKPIKISSSLQFMQALKSGGKVYSLESDVEIELSELITEKFTGAILGNSHKVKINGEISSPMIRELTGKIVDLNFLLEENKFKITQNNAIISEKSSGNIENCKISGDFTVEFNSSEEAFCALFVAKNSGTILDCRTESTSSSVSNHNESNAYFSIFAGVNEKSGVIKNCKISQAVVVADTVDVSGVVAQNYGEISQVETSLTLAQSSDKQWHPNVAGIAVQNYGTINLCVNKGELNAESKVSEAGGTSNYYVFVGGLVCDNYGAIYNSKNYGKIYGKGDISNVVAGGLVAENVTDDDYAGVVVTSLARTDLDVYSKSGQVCVGGVVGLNLSEIDGSGFVGTIDADTNADTDTQVFMNKVDKTVVLFAGGIVGSNQSGKIANSYADACFFAGGKTLGEQGEGDPQKLYAGVCANVGIYAFYEYMSGFYVTNAMSKISKNYYVEKTEIKAHAYGVYASTLGGYYSDGSLQEITDSVLLKYFNAETNEYMIKCSSFDEIPAEVKINE